MPHSSIDKLFDELRERGQTLANLIPCSISLDRDDWIRLQALSELYGIPTEELTARLLGEILQQVEARMPYKPGKQVIRVEDGDPVFEDVGDTPRYLEIKRQLERNGA